MKDLQSLYQTSIMLCDDLNIHYGNILSIEVSNRMSRSLGITYKKENGFVIRISSAVLQDDISDAAIENVIIHEILHTIPYCFNHGKYWTRYAAVINHTYPQLHISQYASPKDYKLPIHMTKKKKNGKEYKFYCKRCGQQLIFYKKTNFVKNHKAYRCSCGGKFKRIKEKEPQE